MAKTDPLQLEILRQYAAGMLGTRQAISLAGLEDYAELLIALAKNELALPKPADTSALRAHVEQGQNSAVLNSFMGADSLLKARWVVAAFHMLRFT